MSGSIHYEAGSNCSASYPVCRIRASVGETVGERRRGQERVACLDPYPEPARLAGGASHDRRAHDSDLSSFHWQANESLLRTFCLRIIFRRKPEGHPRLRG